MNKKLISFLIALVLLCTCAFALAETPSKTTEDLVKVVKTVAADGTSEDALIWVEEIPSTMATSQLADITAFVSKSNPVASYFTEELQTAITGLLPSGTDPDSLVMNEFVNLGIGDCQESFGDITSTFLFPTEFQPGQTIVAMVGYADENGTVVWQALPVIVVNGMLQITFPNDLMIKMGHNAILSILSI